METPVPNLNLSEIFAEGSDLGKSPWVTVDQQMITNFGETTLDPDPMHINPAWSKENSPYGETIAFGFLTSSLLTHLLYGALSMNLVEDVSKQGYVMNYGMDYLRFISPVPVNSRIRGHFKVLHNGVDKKGRNIVKFGCEINIEGVEKPALIAEWLGILIPRKSFYQSGFLTDKPEIYHDT